MNTGMRNRGMNIGGVKRAVLSLILFAALFIATLATFPGESRAQCLCNCYRVEPETECVTALATCAAEGAVVAGASSVTGTAAAAAIGVAPLTKCLTDALAACSKRGGVGGCLCSPFGHLIIQAVIRWQHGVTRDHIKEEMVEHKNFWVNEFFDDYIYKALLGMTHELTAMGMHQVEIVGAMLDAKHQIETQRLLQQLSAEAHKDYHPSADMCTFGTAARGLANADRRAQATALTMTQRSQDRQMGNLNVAAA
ncbi:MAG TPA: hypothetical protein VIG74_06890, partial [Alphaproteobacteria bacterium]